MDCLNPVFQSLIAIEHEIARGQSLHEAAMLWLRSEAPVLRERKLFSNSAYRRSYCEQFATAIRCLEEQKSLDLRHLAGLDSDRPRLSRFREHLFLILESGMKGVPVAKDLRELRRDVEIQLELDLKAHVEALGLKVLLPLLLFMLPAFLILLFGPITAVFLEAM